VKAIPETDARLARELGKALGDLGGRRDDPWIGRLARALREFLPPSGEPAGSKSRPGGEQPGEDSVFELKPGV